MFRLLNISNCAIGNNQQYLIRRALLRRSHLARRLANNGRKVGRTVQAQLGQRGSNLPLHASTCHISVHSPVCIQHAVKTAAIGIVGHVYIETE